MQVKEGIGNKKFKTINGLSEEEEEIDAIFSQENESHYFNGH